MTTIQNPNDMGGTRRTPQAPQRPAVNPNAPRVPAGSAAGTPAGAPAPSVQVSAQGGRFVSLRARLEGLEVDRADRVERLRQAVEAGEYQPDSDATAAAMLKDPATAAALGMPPAS